MAVITKTYRKILSLFLACLGFSGIATSCPHLILGEYGSPSATFKAKGVVVSETGNAPINGI